jgi:hypothetical protein
VALQGAWEGGFSHRPLGEGWICYRVVTATGMPFGIPVSSNGGILPVATSRVPYYISGVVPIYRF